MLTSEAQIINHYLLILKCHNNYFAIIISVLVSSSEDLEDFFFKFLLKDWQTLSLGQYKYLCSFDIRQLRIL